MVTSAEGDPGGSEATDAEAGQIVGGGNAGNTIAARLALDPAGYSVAVVEAGSFYEITEGNRSQVPGLNYIDTGVFPIGFGTTLTLWDLPTEPQDVGWVFSEVRGTITGDADGCDIRDLMVGRFIILLGRLLAGGMRYPMPRDYD
jgi:choline dehydrogenase-like flavoprotein